MNKELNQVLSYKCAVLSCMLLPIFVNCGSSNDVTKENPPNITVEEAKNLKLIPSEDPRADGDQTGIDGNWVLSSMTCITGTVRSVITDPESEAGSVIFSANNTSGLLVASTGKTKNYQRHSIPLLLNFKGDSFTQVRDASRPYSCVDETGKSCASNIPSIPSATVTFRRSGSSLTLESTSDWLCKFGKSQSTYILK